MSRDMTLGVARHFLGALGPVVALSGVLDAGTWDLLVGAGMTIAATVWSVVDKLRR